jgi:nitrous oxide reductase accessory protein NosL
MRRVLFAALSVALIAACARTVKQTRPAAMVAKDDRAHPDRELICEMERPTGSNILVRVCREPESVQREREAAQDKMRELTRPGPHKTSG